MAHTDPKISTDHRAPTLTAQPTGRIPMSRQLSTDFMVQWGGRRACITSVGMAGDWELILGP